MACTLIHTKACAALPRPGGCRTHSTTWSISTVQRLPSFFAGSSPGQQTARRLPQQRPHQQSTVVASFSATELAFRPSSQAMGFTWAGNFTGWSSERDMPDMSGKNVIVTGANSGVGYEVTIGLARKRAKVYMAVRSPEKGTRAAETIKQRYPDADLEIMQIDLSSFSSIRKFAAAFEAKRIPLHVLVNNASEFCQAAENKTEDGFEQDFGANYYGTALLTYSLLDVLKASAPSRVVVQGSLVHAIGWIDWRGAERGDGYAGVPAYAASKLLLMMWAKELATLLQGTGVDVHISHPGASHTRIGENADKAHYPFALIFEQGDRLVGQHPRYGALPALYCASEPSLKGKPGQIIGPNILNMYPTKARWALNLSYYDEHKRHKAFQLANQVLREKVPDVRLPA